ncbi:MAG: hypothetical protein PGN37_14270 [Mycobacterium kyogaense]|uniref:hypothetical protein n=1 Tax=Mycobacterium kyogaense TaxID=2212479 RepID=UPI002FF664E8
MQTALLSGLFALVGVLIAQGIVLYLARKNERRRSDPELLKQCAAFSSAAGRFKRDIATKPREEWDLQCLDKLEEAADSIDIIGTPEIERAAERLIGYVPLVLHPQRFDHDEESAVQGIFDSHREFVSAVRTYFHKAPKEHRAVPIIERP